MKWLIGVPGTGDSFKLGEFVFGADAGGTDGKGVPINRKCNLFNTKCDPVYEVCVPTQIVHRNVYGESVRVHGEADNVYEVGDPMSGEGVPTCREGVPTFRASDFVTFGCFPGSGIPIPVRKSIAFWEDVLNSFTLL